MKKFLLCAAALFAATTAFADYYVIGSNVNGKSWALAQPDALFEDQGNGIYRWEGEVLGTGFKINDGTWSNDAYNIGGNGATIEAGVPYAYGTGSSSSDIGLYEVTVVNKPVIVLDENAKTITLTGEFEGEIQWFLTGINGVWEANPEKGTLMEPTDDYIFVAKNVSVEVAEGEVKVSSTGWAKKYGTNDPDNVVVDADHFNQAIALDEVFGEAGNIPYVLEPGNYDFTFNSDEKTLTVAPSAGSGVAGIEVESAPAVYYNLQGIRVANPQNGIFVKVSGKKAVKVVLSE